MPLNWSPLWLSLRVAGIATAISLAVGIYLAYVLANRLFAAGICSMPRSLCR